MDIINILPDSVANQIAAGEVVDRPASAVKELLENAIDAGATHIDLVVKDAGRTLIQVIDNGCGMSDSDARLCFERHATSKIHHADDLFAIRTMGFRGEALASIAAIAQVELRTRLHDAELGTEIAIEGSKIIDQHPTACPIGTSLAVKNLFFNVPARRAFLKRDSVEMAHIEETFRRVTLTHPDIAFSLSAGGRTLYDLAAGSMLQRISSLFADSYKERLFPVEEVTDLVRIKGFVARPEFSRRSRGEQYLFVDGRFIKHPGLSRAVEKAYSSLIPDGNYPSYFISMQVDPSRIDINIHPAKTEVKFADESALYAILHSAVKKALGQFSLATELSFDTPPEFNIPPAPKGYNPPPPSISYNPDYNPFRATPSQTRMKLEPSDDNHAAVHRHLQPLPNSTQPLPEEPSIPEPINHGSGQASSCLQLQGRYIVTPLSSGLAIIDQHRAHQRILFDRLADAGPQHTPSQALLFPIQCHFSAADADLFGELLPDLLSYGFAIESTGQSTFVVTATPPDVDTNNLQNFFDMMITDCKGASMRSGGLISDTVRASLARQMAIRPGRVLTDEEMQQMVADLFACPMADTAPDGRPIITIVKPEQLLK